uniref:Serine/threonine-protein phosphatase n=3 Tax=Onchocercidae TaxID=6296 RepID=A0A1I8EBZ4_WUCBA
MSEVNINDLILRLLNVGQPDKGLTKTVRELEIASLCHKAREIFMAQPSLIEIDPPVRICGDTHGQYGDLLRIFSRGGFPPLANYLFLGDYVDRGHQNLETIILLFCYKVKFPNNFFLLRGNHECANVNRVYGFYEECMRRFNSIYQVMSYFNLQNQKYGMKDTFKQFRFSKWLSLQDTFQCMPLTALVGERILCMHGGISPQLKSLQQLREIKRPVDITSPSLEMDLLWADPVIGISGFQMNMRGASFGFGADILAALCKELNIDMVARAHQVVQDGYEFFGARKCVTIFSAPHYCGQFDNAAAVMSVDQNLLCSFQILRPTIGRATARIIPTSMGKC